MADTVEDDEQILCDIGAAAAHYLETTLKDGEIVGISSWRSTLLAMADAMQALPASVHAQVVQLLGAGQSGGRGPRQQPDAAPGGQALTRG